VEHTERVCGAHRACAAAAACETRGNPDRGMSSSAFHTSVEHTERVCGAHRACAAAAACETRGNPDRGMSSSAFPHDPAEASTTPGPHDPAASSLFEALGRTYFEFIQANLFGPGHQIRKMGAKWLFQLRSAPGQQVRHSFVRAKRHSALCASFGTSCMRDGEWAASSSRPRVERSAPRAAGSCSQGMVRAARGTW
jgi:hypothetical protein